MNGIALIPAYKPDAKLTDLVRELVSRSMTVVVVDDGSGERFRPLFDGIEENAFVIRCEKNGGKGAAIKTGLRYIREHFTPPYTVVTADADGQHRVKDIVRVAKAAKKCPEALVIGCRTISRSMPLRNWFGNFYTKIAFLFATGKRAKDTQTGLRGFTDKTLPFMLGIKGRRYEYEMNVLLHWARCNRRMVEIPIRTIYHDGNSTSHFHAVRDSLIIYGQIFKFSAPPFFCFLLDMGLFVTGLMLPLRPAFLVANLIARLGSTTLFFILRQRSVSRYFDWLKLSFPRCVIYSAADFVLDTTALWLLLLTGMPPVAAKALADVMLFFTGFIPQRKYLYVARDAAFD